MVRMEVLVLAPRFVYAFTIVGIIDLELVDFQKPTVFHYAAEQHHVQRQPDEDAGEYYVSI